MSKASQLDVQTFNAKPLPTEQEIMKTWQGDINNPVVSVLCNTFNQKCYIEDAFKGFLTQKTDFPFEVIVHDDASTDGTTNIVREYASKYPHIIKPVIQVENQYSKGGKPTQLSFPHSKGEYIAFCEGDDFWISESKLTVQVNALRKVHDCEICFHSAIKVTNDTVDNQLFCEYKGGDQIIAVGPVIRRGGSFMPAASMLIRRTFFDRIFKDNSLFYKKYLRHYFYQIFCSISGGAMYLNSPMSVYRSMAAGSWSESMASNQEFYKIWLSNYLTSLREANVKTNYKYEKDFMIPIRNCHLSVLNNINLDKSFRKEYFLEVRKEIGIMGFVLWQSVFRFHLVHTAFRMSREKANKIKEFFCGNRR